MNKSQLVEKINEKIGMNKESVQHVVDAMTTIVKESVKRGDDVKLVGFGTFTKGKRKARICRNPRTGQNMKLPAHWTPKFKAGKEFKGLVK